MLNSERAYVDLIFRATKKYASWDPEVLIPSSDFQGADLGSKIAVKAGDWGRITQGRRGLAFWRKNGTFVREGNIYSDGKAEKFGIPPSVEYGRESEGQTWITSENAEQVDLSALAGGIHPALAQCNAKAAFKFSSGRGAILAMENEMITIIEPPGALQRLLQEPRMRGVVVVSEVHCCSSYARLLTAEGGGTVALGLSVEPPVANIASASATATWIRNLNSGNFKSQVNTKGERSFYPLFRLVSRSEEETSTGIGSAERT